ncbi:hypothetical protein PUNSTDRAFT_130441 [Punctularia strigosozonata HHB-11173 SS5]|uniref:uncharacterized protein n=1 Tax=Punctularia strigosozonata (strain HHB-11173) TaxID=741275 RepID=UPI0004417235|nr:uncharacterized protein PUNSTDRAFT_130441 [Punctularia strigosozonata HHB-11173 SS5]EIN12172.1 hypothetical protein PUNSTDRAFT_130441 [Punctularia strigosozonata HHB-11173 SS5]
MLRLLALFSVLSHVLLNARAYIGDGCSETVLVTEAVKVHSHIVNITIPSCDHGHVPSPAPVDIQHSVLARHLGSRLTTARRSLGPLAERDSVSECAHPNICQCGQSCAVSCQTFSTVDPAPTTSDCETLVQVLRNMPSLIGPTFVQGTGFPNPIIIDFSTCRAALGNTRADKAEIEYCWDGLANSASAIVSDCLAPGLTLGGDCTASSGSWQSGISGLLRS